MQKSVQEEMAAVGLPARFGTTANRHVPGNNVYAISFNRHRKERQTKKHYTARRARDAKKAGKHQRSSTRAPGRPARSHVE